MSKLIDDSGSLVDAQGPGPHLIWTRGPWEFPSGQSSQIHIDPKWRRLDVNIMLRNASLLFPDSVNCDMSGNGAFKWIKADKSVVQWLAHLDRQTHPKWFGRGRTALRASFLRMDTGESPFWMADVQVSFHSSAGNESLTGAVWIDQESGNWSYGSYGGEAGEVSASMYGWM